MSTEYAHTAPSGSVLSTVVAGFKFQSPIRWTNSAGVHQDLTFAVHPDPLSGAHAWHQRVRITKAEAGDQESDVEVDTVKSHAFYKEWLALARPAPGPGGMRRPYWLLRPLRPAAQAYQMDARAAVTPPTT